jgi:hypothetical protein
MEKSIMNKKIIAAAVAATMTSGAFADISLTGAAKVNYTNTQYADTTADDNHFTQEMDLKVKGKSGDTEVVINFGGGALDGDSLVNGSATKNDSTGASVNGSGNQMNVEDAYVSTKVNGISIKTGTWDDGNNYLRESARKAGKFEAKTSVGPINLTYGARSSGADSESYGVSTTTGGVTLGYTKKATSDEVKVSGAFAGISAEYHGIDADAANSDKSSIVLSTTVDNIGIKVGKASADSSVYIGGDSWMGDFEESTAVLQNGQDVTAVEVSTSIAGNKVAYRNVEVDDVASSDMTYNKVIVTRPLASGTTFELTYTQLDDDGVTNEKENVLDLELSVGF